MMCKVYIKKLSDFWISNDRCNKPIENKMWDISSNLKINAEDFSEHTNEVSAVTIKVKSK